MTRATSQPRARLSSILHRGRPALVALAILVAAEAAAQAGDAAVPPDEPTGSHAEAPSVRFQDFDDKAFLAARKSGQPIVLYFEADWCAPCQEMHTRTFREPSVLAASSGMQLFRVDMTTASRRVEVIQQSFQVVGAPTVIVFSPGGKEAARRSGFIPPDAFTEMLAKARTAPSSS